LFVGTWIDRYGTRRIWMSALTLLSLASLSHIAVVHFSRGTVQQPTVFAVCAALRIAVFCAVAGIYGSSITFVARRVPGVRMAETLGILGTSGFLGMVSGAWLGDLLLSSQPATAGSIDRLFLASGLLGLLAAAAANWAMAGQNHAPPRRHPRAWNLVRRYHPGRVLVMGIAMGFGLGLPGTFLRAFAADLQISRIALFFAVYAATAIVTRVLARRVFAWLGLRPVVVIGLSLLIGSQFLFLLVHTEWHLAAPALGYGLAHAVLFPAGFAEGCSTFPPRYRGLGTSLMLATYDLGQLLGAPIAGGIIHYSTQRGWPAYPVMFLSVATILTVATLVYLPRRPRHC
jgi:MFS family permease